MAAQFLQGDQGVQISDAEGSTFVITYNNGTKRAVPLERASVPIPPGTRSPARLMRARSGVVPFVARRGLRDDLIRWLEAGVPFAGAVVGGAGGTGKTRLAVELCDWAEGTGWLSGILARIEDPASLEALAEAPFPRLVAVDYAESRAAQLQVLLPLLASRATAEAPVRVLLLVRAGPRRTTDWTEGLRNQSDLLDNVLDQCETHILEDLPLEAAERAALFTAASKAFADRLGAAAAPAPANLRSDDFASPLLVVLAAYLATQGDQTPHTREELLRAVIAHEERHWRSSSGDLFADEDQPRHVVALTTLLDARTEAEAIQHLRVLPDLVDGSAERLGLIARWARKLYPGTGWWNPLEPDIIGEQLISDQFSEQQDVLSAALAGDQPGDLIRPLEVLGRAAADHPRLAAELQPILGGNLDRLCALAVAQGGDLVDRDLLYGGTETVAAVLEKAIAAMELDPDSLVSALTLMPPRFDLVLSPLALTLNVHLVEHKRSLAAADPVAHERELARSLNNLSNRLGEAGRYEEGLELIEESVEIRRRLSSSDPLTHEPELASALNNLSIRLAEAGRREEGLAPIEESVGIYRRIAADQPTVYERALAIALNNLSNRLAEAGHREAALAPVEESVEIRRRLAAADPAAHGPDLAGALNNLSIRQGEAGNSDAALGPIEESVEIYRLLAAANPAAFEPDLASSLNNLSNRLGAAGRREEALARIEEAVELRRRLAAANPAVFEPDLATSLNNVSNRLAGVGRGAEALVPIEESVEIRRRLAVAYPGAHEPDLAGSLNNLSNRLAEAGRGEGALGPVEESVGIRGRLAAANPTAFEPALASSLNNLSNRLSAAGRSEEALAPIEAAVEIRGRLAAANPPAFEPDLATSLNNLSNRLAEAGRSEEALAPIEAAVEIRRRLAAANPAAFEPELAGSLSNLSNHLAEAGDGENALAAIEAAVEIRRRLAAANPAAFEPVLAGSLNNLSNRRREADFSDALALVEEAVEIYRRLAAADPASFEPDLAIALNNLSLRLAEADRREEAEVAAAEAERLISS